MKYLVAALISLVLLIGAFSWYKRGASMDEAQKRKFIPIFIGIWLAATIIIFVCFTVFEVPGL